MRNYAETLYHLHCYCHPHHIIIISTTLLSSSPPPFPPHALSLAALSLPPPHCSTAVHCNPQQFPISTAVHSLHCITAVYSLHCITAVYSLQSPAIPHNCCPFSPLPKCCPLQSPAIPHQCCPFSATHMDG